MSAETKAAMVEQARDAIRRIHHYGYPPDERLAGRVESDVDEILTPLLHTVTELRSALSWALDILDMYDERLAARDGAMRVYTPVHVAAKAKARGALAATREREEARDRVRQLEAAVTVATEERRETIRDLNLEWDSLRGCYWLPAEPGPVECQSVPHAVREVLRLAHNDHHRLTRALAEARRDGQRLEWLDRRAKDEGWWRDIVLCHDQEDGVWLASVERGSLRGGRPIDMSEHPLPTLRAAIDAAMEAARVNT